MAVAYIPLGESLIQEEAEARLGGPEKLAAAVRRGAIKAACSRLEGECEPRRLMQYNVLCGVLSAFTFWVSVGWEWQFKHISI